MRVSGCVVLATALAGVAIGSSRLDATAARPNRAGFHITNVLGGLSNPTTVTVASDGRVFVAEVTGKIKVFSSISDTTPSVFADLSTEVYSFQGRGLLGLALDPGFPTKPYVYALYARDSKTRGGPVPQWKDKCPDPDPGAGCVNYSRLVRLTASGNVAVGTPKVLIDDWCNQFQHGVAGLEFGPDGMLYASSGEGASYMRADYGQSGSPLNPCGDPPSGIGGVLAPPTTEGGSLRAQDVRTDGDPAGLAGSVIRVNPATGVAAAGNPFATSTDANKRRIIAYGERNPFRMAFRPGTKQLWTANAGWNSFEEINRIPNATDAVAENFGWPCYEGSGRQPTWDGLDINLCESLYATPGAATGPAFQYGDFSHVVATDGCLPDPTLGTSIAGITFYSGSSYPTLYRKGLFFVDYGRKCLWVAPADASGAPVFANRKLVTKFASVGVTDLAAGPGGDVLLVNYATSTVQRLTYG